MGQNYQRNAQDLTSSLTEGVKDLFSERARWVQTWIASMALPFAALLLFALSYLQVGTGNVLLPRQASLLLSIILFSIVGLRAAWLYKHNLSQFFSKYQTSLFFLALLLLFGNPDGNHSLVYWLFMLIAFWAVGFAYPLGCLMPGEFVIVALVVAGTSVSAVAPFAEWLYVAVAFGPIIAWLQLKHQMLKPALFLAAILLATWAGQDFQGAQIVLALIFSIALLGMAIYAIGKLNRNNASSLIQSIGLGVISGLIAFVTVRLFGNEWEAASTWWKMLPVFLALAVVLSLRHGRSLAPLLALWSVHWICMTFYYTWADQSTTFTGELWGAHTALLSGSLLAGGCALYFNSNRLYIWSRIYLVFAVISISPALFEQDEGASLPRLLFLFLLFCIGLYLAEGKQLQKGPPWWKGAVNARHVVAVRKIGRTGGNLIASIPFVGATLSATLNFVRVLIKMKRNTVTFHSGDLMLIVVVILGAIYLGRYIELFVLEGLIDLLEAEPPPFLEIDLTQWRAALVQKITLVMAGVLFGIAGIFQREQLYPLLAMVSFIFAPTAMLLGQDPGSAFFWLISLVSAIGILSLNELHGEQFKQRGARRNAGGSAA